MTAPVVSERDLVILRSFASRIDPSDAGAHNNLGVLYFRRGLDREAAQAFTRALCIRSDDTILTKLDGTVPGLWPMDGGSEVQLR